MKTLIYDIELSKAIALVYPSHKPQYIPPSSYIEDQFMPCAAWKWLDEDEIYSACVLDDAKRFKENFRDHGLVVKALYDAIEEADILVGHNSDGFDQKHLNWFALNEGLPPLPQKQTVDTLKLMRSVFRAPSNKLDELTNRLIGERKMQTSPGMHDRVAQGDPAAIREMLKYNIQDARIQDKFYKFVRPWAKTHPTVRTRDYNGELVPTCQYCHSINLVRRNVRYLKSGRARAQWRCQETECGGYTTTDLVN
jgi:hypothetical protein